MEFQDQAIKVLKTKGRVSVCKAWVTFEQFKFKSTLNDSLSYIGKNRGMAAM